MAVKVILVVSLLAVCGAIEPENHTHSNQAISSQSFVRHDVPLSYKYTAVHVYSTPKPNQHKHEPLELQHHVTRTPPPKEIQYAPIYNGQINHHGFPGQKSEHGDVRRLPERQNVLTKQTSHLEPKPQEIPAQLYVPGYNVELFQAVNRYPGHNAVYRSFPNMAPQDKINNVNYLNQYVLYQKPEEPYKLPANIVNESALEKPAEPKVATLSPFVPKHVPLPQKPKLYNAAHVAAFNSNPSSQAILNLHELIAHPKAHKMLLNIARSYNFAHNPSKAQQASITLNKLAPVQAQEIVLGYQPADIQRNLRLLSIPSKQISQLVHRLS